MATRLVVKQTVNLTHKEYLACRRLTFGINGQMQAWLDDFYDQEWGLGSKYNSWVYLIKDQESGKILSWAIVFPRIAPHGTQHEWIAQFYTHTKFRRKGLGGRLARKIEKDFGEVDYIPHDPTSERFFNSVGWLHCKNDWYWND